MPSENKHLVRRLFLELWNQRKLAVADEIFAPGYVHHDPATPDFGKGPEGVKQTAIHYRNAFPDLLFTVNQMIDAGQLITTRFTSQGTHKGELRGIAPTNKPIKVEGMVIHRISGGHIVEGWVMWDALGLMQQLGVIPALEKVTPKGSS
jgi:steroid delta-isomerase-like uncharacterized protein